MNMENGLCTMQSHPLCVVMAACVALNEHRTVKEFVSLLDGAVGTVWDHGRGVTQHEPGDPALGRRALLGGRPEHQEHVLLIAGQDLDHFTLSHADLVLLHRHVVLGHQHGGYATAAATFTLHHQKVGEKNKKKKNRYVSEKSLWNYE